MPWLADDVVATSRDDSMTFAVNRYSTILLVLFFHTTTWAQEPQAEAVFPLGGTRGTEFQAEVQGPNLEGAYAVWFDCQDLTATVEKVEPVTAVPAQEETKKSEKEENK